MPDPGRRRLNSWKEISAYLDRDVRTVSRWEKHRGLPIRRLPGGGRSVFAYTDEVDAWLAGGGAEEGTALEQPVRRSPGRRWALIVSLGVVVIALLSASKLWPRTAPVVTVELQGSDVVARAASGSEVWRHTFAERIRFVPNINVTAVTDLDGDGTAEVAAVIAKPTTSLDDDGLYLFDADGRLLWERRITETLTYRGGRYLPPWSTGPITVARVQGQPRIVWASHHHTWWPSIVALFDRSGRLVSSFRHAGWITSISGTPQGRVVVAGVSNHFDTDVVAVLDDASWPGAEPSPAGTPYECVDCPAGRPLRYFVLPRLELNRAAGAKRRSAHLHVYPNGRMSVRIVQDAASTAPGEFILDLTEDHRASTARVSDDYWQWHRMLESQGLVKHSAEACPDKQPFPIKEWERGRGWAERRVGPSER